MGLSSIRSGEPERAALSGAAAAPTVGELAWIALLPCALMTALAVLALGPLVGHALLSPHGEALWPREAVYVFGRPEPEKHGRFLTALLGPVLLAAVVLAGARRPERLRLRPELLRGMALGAQLLLGAALLAVTLAQRHVVYDALPTRWRILTPATLVVAAALAALLALAPRTAPVARRLPLLRADGRGVRAACLGVALAATALWLLPAIITERAIADSPFPDLVPWATGDAYAILDGRTPLVDFNPLYGHVWGYLAAGPMAVFGDSVGVFSVAMALGSGLALLSVYALLRRIAGSAPLALALYLPFLATSLFVVATDDAAVSHVTAIVSNSEIYSVWPMRYGGPLLLAWLTVRRLDAAGGGRHRVWPLFLAGGLVVANNLEFGVGALLGTLAALLCLPATRSRAGLRRLARDAAAGLLAALALVALVTLVRAGSLPHLGMLTEFPRVFGVLGLAELPLALVGFHLAIYATLSAALVVAAARVARREPDVALTGMLAWSGVFGLFGASYFVGRSDPLKLAALLPAWSLALVLLVVVATRALAARGWRRPSVAELLVLYGFGVALCSLAQLPSPSAQLDRLRPAGVGHVFEQPEAHELVARTTTRGEHVAIVIPLGHRIAYDEHVVNVSPYAFLDEIATRRQFANVLGAMRAEGARKLYVLSDHLAAAQRAALRRAGFAPHATEAQYAEWVGGGAGSG